MKYLKYLWYVVKHKWYVAMECLREGIYWRGLCHDMSKLRLDEFVPYARFFFSDKPGVDITSPSKACDEKDEDFERAWMLHQKRNRHHWQWWVLFGMVIPMREPYRTEMVCDWVGAGKAQGRFSPKGDRFREVRVWYEQEKKNINLHPKTRKWVEDKIYERI